MKHTHANQPTSTKNGGHFPVTGRDGGLHGTLVTFSGNQAAGLNFGESVFFFSLSCLVVESEQ